MVRSGVILALLALVPTSVVHGQGGLATAIGRSGVILTAPSTDTAGGMFSDGSGSLSLRKVLTTDLSSVTGADTNVVTGTAGTSLDLATWNADGDLVDGPTPPSGTIVGTTDSQTLTNKTFTLGSNTFSGTKAQFNTALTDGSFTYVGFEPITGLNFTGENRITTVGATTTELDAEATFTYDGNLLTQLTTSSAAARNVRIQQHNDATGGPKLDFYKSSNTDLSPTIIANGAVLGQAGLTDTTVATTSKSAGCGGSRAAPKRQLVSVQNSASGRQRMRLPAF